MQVINDQGQIREPRALEVAQNKMVNIISAVGLLYVLKSYEEAGLDGVKAFNREHKVLTETMSDETLMEVAGVLQTDMVSFTTGLQDLRISEKEASVFLDIRLRWFHEDNTPNTQQSTNLEFQED